MFQTREANIRTHSQFNRPISHWILLSNSFVSLQYISCKLYGVCVHVMRCDTHLKLQFITLWTISTHKRNLDAYQLPGFRIFTKYTLHGKRVRKLCIFCLLQWVLIYFHMYGTIYTICRRLCTSRSHSPSVFFAFISPFVSVLVHIRTHTHTWSLELKSSTWETT